MAAYEVMFTDGSSVFQHAEAVRYEDHGVVLEGPEAGSLVVFVPYVNLRMLREVPPAR